MFMMIILFWGGLKDMVSGQSGETEDFPRLLCGEGLVYRRALVEEPNRTIWRERVPCRFGSRAAESYKNLWPGVDWDAVMGKFSYSHSVPCERGNHGGCIMGWYIGGKLPAVLFILQCNANWLQTASMQTLRYWMDSDKAQNVHAYLCLHSLNVLLNLHASIYCAFDNHTHFLLRFDRAFTSAHSGLILVRHSQVYQSVCLFYVHFIQCFYDLGIFFNVW